MHIAKTQIIKIGMHILCKGLYRLQVINNLISFNSIKMKRGSPTNLIKDRHDYNLILKRHGISNHLPYKVCAVKD
jgi:hypothetical protein